MVTLRLGHLTDPVHEGQRIREVLERVLLVQMVTVLNLPPRAELPQ
jgi:hypothetical protein